eukprot:TRINITY_DN35195_c0_g1_i1.p1 TRINITY_DN35195_c0_g1~~TRINITY_DN35195_c0_g1_i1.p1  ORF type:complete len:315 (+),score=65.46 TRINITY_DN35195_c0_g1_i1:55-999(+)
MSAPWARACGPEDPLDKPARKRIRSVEDVGRWQKTESFTQLNNFLTTLGDSVAGVSNEEGRKTQPGPAMRKILEILDRIKKNVEEIPLHDMKQQRYGNKAFKEWYGRMDATAESDMRSVLREGGADESKAAELAVYWRDAFGNPIRIDYGTGHELNFVMVLYCLTKLGGVLPTDPVVMVTQAVTSYISLMRILQTHYSMEPAGSKGVWGLDDYHHLIFFWGAAQLVNHPTLHPSNVKETSKDNQHNYLYLEGIHWILTNKSGSFQENSPTLASLSDLQWTKIQKGMLKMYHGEVLHQWPVMQHLCFGTIFPWQG